jgi:hypothetical protein
MRRAAVIGLAVALAACQGGAFRAAVSPEFHSPPPLQPRHHQLRVTINPTSLTAEDQITLQPNGTLPATIAFYLSRHMRLDAVTLHQHPLEFRRQPPQLPPGAFNRQRYVDVARMTRYEAAVPPALTAGEPLIVTVRYGAEWPSTDRPAHFGESGWHPTWPDALVTFELGVDHPADWTIVSAGTLQTHHEQNGRGQTTWVMAQPSESIDLLAGPYEVTTRADGATPISTYFFSEDAALAPAYLDAAADYLASYSRLLGPYPFQKLAIVETALPVGAAVPSIVLLGQPLVRRHYTQPYALGHEIVHAWLGNHVMADEAQGNWTEALTTYLANYYTVEEAQGEEAARQQRRQMLLQYATWTTPATDYPLMRFLQNDSQRDAAIGYQKGAMVFHQLRRMIGDDEFFGALRELTEQFGGKRAGWNDLRLLFEVRMGRPLDWFFRQWVVERGAPRLAIDRVEFTPLPAELEAPEGTMIRVHLAQTAPLFRLPVTIHIETQERILEKSLWMDQAHLVVETAAAATPIRITVDPEWQLFRRLERDELPPMLNLTLTEPSLAVIPPQLADAGWAELYQRIADQAVERHNAARLDGPKAATTPGQMALFLLGGPDQNHAAAQLATHLPANMTIGPRAFAIDGRAYADPSQALLLTLRDPSRGHRPTTLLYGFSAEAVSPLTSTLYYQGWDSYIVFDKGRAIAKGSLPPLRSPLVWTPP